ncbi:NTP transferase domain-containing protein [Oscillochloris sp. ZM17-4]|uniref:sugar phosphate nucleotidyltransferase n=1 Tax=Oscillochloris sp. ZM17-4 TaxID=2866714 RepID=UPI001C73CFDD|nr:sugar phosphate nucleotidyltransferase [Oscillochloris sp. ZM17-4]MBX0327135.1 NTP transferase domain-containing protein [Oscillochloris sp. ZM17-4]
MKVMILTAGLGTRLRPHTYSKPKPLVSVAGKPVLAHIIDDLLDIQIDELICVTGYLGDQIERYVRDHYTMPMRFLVQQEMRGQADAIYLAKDAEGPMLVVFGDGLVGIDKDRLNAQPDEGIIYCQEVEDPSRFGVAVVQDDQITRLVEKPSTPVSNLAVVGFYYLPEARRLMDAITHMMEHNIQTKGEYYLADALQIMLERGEVFRAETVSMWRDCGTIDALLDTNRYLLEHGHSRDGAVANSVIVPPVYIGPGAKVENAVLGPHVSLGAGAVVRNAIISDSIINTGAQIEGAVLSGSVIGDKAAVTGAGQELNIGDAATIRIR